jgi:hypothetical protein
VFSFLPAFAGKVATVSERTFACEETHQSRSFRLRTANPAREAVKPHPAPIFHGDDVYGRAERKRCERRSMRAISKQGYSGKKNGYEQRFHRRSSVSVVCFNRVLLATSFILKRGIQASTR